MRNTLLAAAAVLAVATQAAHAQQLPPVPLDAPCMVAALTRWLRSAQCAIGSASCHPASPGILHLWRGLQSEREQEPHVDQLDERIKRPSHSTTL